ncbi:MAG: DUF3866 family protein [Clostridia bacterium]|nr:DUF3866 family protein [Clostridia bacterium]
MIVIKQGIVKEIMTEHDNIQVILVDVEGSTNKAINYVNITGRLEKNEKVFLNNTAVSLGLGTGGYDFVLNGQSTNMIKQRYDGHIMKMRYTPIQFSCLTVEEKNHQYNDIFNKFKSLNKMPCIIAPLHSSIAPFAAALKYIKGMNVKISYIMTEGGCLPLSFSNTVRQLKSKGLIDHTITYGNAFGGDFETINIYTALIAAKYIASADVTIIAMGPGIVGSNTRYGHTAVEQAIIIDAATAIGGNTFTIPRIGFSDSRIRHLGISHHSIIVLYELCINPSTVCFPLMKKEKMNYILNQIKKYAIHKKHNIIFRDGSIVKNALKSFELEVTTMGRNFNQEPEFFMSAGSMARLISDII